MKLLRKIFSPGLILVTLTLLAYTFYKSEIVWYGVKRDFYFVYYLFSLLLVALTLISFFLKNSQKDYLIICLITSVITLYAFEFYLIKYPPIDKKLSKEQSIKEKLYKEKTGKKYDTRTKHEIYNELKKKDKDIKVIVHPTSYISENSNFIPLSGISNSKTIFCNENGYYSIYQSDRHGFNNPDYEWESKEIEYLLVGDSFTHGACVNRPHDIASVLRQLSNKSALNLGYVGNGSLIHYATIKEYLNPKVNKILWMFYEGNDLLDLRFELTNKVFKNYLVNNDFNQNLKYRQIEIDNVANQKIISGHTERVKEIKKKFNFFEFIKLINIRNITNNYLPKKYQPSNQPVPFFEFKKILNLANNLAKNNNSKLFFVYLPEYKRYKIKYDNEKYQKIRKIVNELNIPFINIDSEVFKKEKNPLSLFSFELENHYTINGYYKVAETIFKKTIINNN